MADNTKDPEIPEMLGIRLEPKTRYLAELAARTQRKTLTAYVEEAIINSFSNVTLYRTSEQEATYGSGLSDVSIDAIDAKQEQIQSEAMRVSIMGDSIWSENPITRLEIRALSLPHLMTDEDEAFRAYIHSREDLKIKVGKGYKLNREFIAANWKTIKADFEKPKKGKA
jgi:hypothetical protein